LRPFGQRKLAELEPDQRQKSRRDPPAQQQPGKNIGISGRAMTCYPMAMLLREAIDAARAWNDIGAL
jgi:hypothetical protein